MILPRVKRRVRVMLGRSRGWITYCGAKVYFPPHSYAASCVLNTGSYEHDITTVLRAAVRPDSFVFDVGANIGLSALPLLRDVPSVQVVSFEASPGVYEYLKRTHAGSPYRANWHLVNAAATSRHGQTISFTVHQASGDVYDGIRPTGRAAVAHTVDVPATTIDHEWLARGRPPVSLIKVDTEGAEIQVLEGAAECIRTCCPAVVTEWCPKNFAAYGCGPEAMFDLARHYGYDLYAIPPMSRVTESNVLPYLLELHENLLLLPPADGRGVK